MEQGAALRIEGDTIIVAPRNDIYVRYLSDNRSAIGELATELYGRKIKVEMGAGGERPEAAPTPPPSRRRSAPARIARLHREWPRRA